MQIPAYDSPIYDRAIELIHIDTARLDAYSRTIRNIATCSESQLSNFRDQLLALIEDAVIDATEEADAERPQPEPDPAPLQIDDFYDRNIITRY